MKKIHPRLLNLAFWLELLLTYLLPFRHSGSAARAGFPLSFISIGGSTLGVNPLMSMHLNPLVLAVDVFLIYALLVFVTKLYTKLRK